MGMRVFRFVSIRIEASISIAVARRFRAAGDEVLATMGVLGTGEGEKEVTSVEVAVPPATIYLPPCYCTIQDPTQSDHDDST